MRENKDLKEFKEFKELMEIWKGKGEGEKAKKNCAGNAGAVVFECYSNILLQILQTVGGVGVAGLQGQNLVVIVGGKLFVTGFGCCHGKIVVHGDGIVDVRFVLVGGELLKQAYTLVEVIYGYAAYC